MPLFLYKRSHSVKALSPKARFTYTSSSFYQECCFPLILFFPFENLIVYFASEYSLYHIIFFFILLQRYGKYLKMNKISEENPIPPKFFIAKYTIPPKFFIAKYPIPPKSDVRWEVSLIRKVRRNLFPHGLSYYIVIEASALTFWIIAINQVTISIQVSLLFSCLLQ